MDQYEFIRTAHRVYGLNISELARTSGHCRNTVKKAIRGEPWGYQERQHQPFPVLGPYLEAINRWLTEDKDRPKKQRHTARRIKNRLVKEHGYKGSESTVRRYVRMAKISLGLYTAQAFIPCDPEAGYEAEVDWGTATVNISGQEKRLKFFCMRSKYSGKHFVKFYPCERQQALFDAHIQGFQYFGGVFPVLIYDNLTTAIRKVLMGKKRVEQESFSKFKAYYSFDARFCNPGEGHEKGGVEGMIGFARRNYMVPVPSAGSLQELNDNILEQCLSYGNHRMSGRDRKVNELFEEEKEHLVCLPDAVFSNLQSHSARVDKYATVIVDKNRYSVPSRYVGFKVKVLLGVESVKIFYGTQKLASHERLYDNNKWSLNPDHYLELIQQRPMAFNSARPIRQWKESWPESLNRLLARFRCAQGETKGIKDFISVLMLYRQYTGQEIEAAVEVALKNNISSGSGVRHILICKQEPRAYTASLESWPTLPPPDITVYDQLGGAI